jgi:Ni/Fe-hydrogenase subunit HybB-like protein
MITAPSEPRVHSPHAPTARRTARLDLPPLLTRGTTVLLILMGAGAIFAAYRFFFGLAASTNLDQQYPWGIWIVADVSFIALAAGGFTMAAIVHIFHREHFHALARPVLLFALLGYTCACIALFADLGKYYNIWHPLLPSMWQGNSALFEVGMCVMCYLTVLYIEFVPVFCERFMGKADRPRLARVCTRLHGLAEKVMPVIIILGVGISCLHQSSLGHVMVLTPTKLHPLWYTPVLSLMFLVSAIAVGFPTAIFVSLVSSWALKRKADMAMLSKLAMYVPMLVAVYLALKVGDMVIRESYVYLWAGTRDSLFFLIEVLLGLLLPLAMLIRPRVRHSPRWLGSACALVMFGIVLNRANVYIIGYHPPYTDKMYYPSLTEWMVTIGAVAALIFIWRAIATYFPVLGPEQRKQHA